ncbi:precorrin-2 dehydrogenase [Halanaerobium saccharolyticum]|uniref:precorrin-2 dehydrogenase n=1 Tax=Halanaerobium saccharolyticum TaxID=43595 RepID=A0A4R7Z5R0_9FIRM|nr:bifunctional precorrin-2 dehydrogenase/sirohydrochlorin ferrochelatase [Halanaerobium saccharolyticum]RAK10599.1 precorrin-2 dehydrogenase [Halanaerobium saccharolyticum]TDW06644.1 precorrin-2 dehydrogenase [Halanaerobium saccharolyticum]TDX62279.1 precorrin-2 dehydrogenase [Halanaerobium saccharolyticum]
MKFYPINLNLKDKKVLIVGAGKVALRKFKRLLQTGAQIKIIAPKYNQKFAVYRNPESKKYIFLERKFQEKDLIGQFLVFAATDNSELNQRIALLAREKNILVNLIDNAELSDFTVPAMVKRGELLLTAASGSNLPALSKNIRKKLESDFGLEYEFLLDIMSEKRQRIIEDIDSIELRKLIFREIASADFLAKIREIIADYNPQILDSSDYQPEHSEYQTVKKAIEKSILQLIERKKYQAE